MKDLIEAQIERSKRQLLVMTAKAGIQGCIELPVFLLPQE